MHELLDWGARMVIRQCGTRDLVFGGKRRNELDLALKCPMNYAESIVKEIRRGEKRYDLDGMRKVKLPGRDEQMTLVVAKGFGKKPLMLLTNLPVQRSRKSIWKIVEAYLSCWRGAFFLYR